MDVILALMTILILLFIGIIGYYMTKNRERSQRLSKIQQKIRDNQWSSRSTPSEWASPSKCFSCENQMSNKQKYLAEPSKCYSCERQTSRAMGSQFAIQEQTTKCFDC